MKTPLLALACLLVIFWLFTLCRIAISRYEGRYTKRRWLLNVGNFGLLGLLLYWVQGERQRVPRQ
ncbi:MAG: hypothetical protein ACRYFX_23935 [Janthinobacterium lividum]